MKPLDAHGRELRQIEARQDVQHHQHGDARAVRRALPDVVALVQGADRRGGLGGVRLEIVQRVQPADAAQGLDHVLGDGALVERVAAVLGDRAQRLAELGLMDHVAGHRRLAVRQQIALGVDALLQLVELVVPVEGDAGSDDIAFLRGLDRGLQQGVEAELAVIAQDSGPGVDRARNGDGMRRGQRDRVDLALEIPFGLSPPAARGPSRYRPRSCPRPWAGPARSSRRRSRWIAARSPRAAHRPPPRRRRRCRRPAAPRPPPARPADATSPPFRSGRGPWTGRRDGSSSYQIAHFSIFVVSGAIYLAYLGSDGNARDA